MMGIGSEPNQEREKAQFWVKGYLRIKEINKNWAWGKTMEIRSISNLDLKKGQ